MNDLEVLLDKALEILRRDIANIFSQSSDKLSAHAARDLVAYIKLLMDVSGELKDANAALAKMTQEDLKELAKKLVE